MAVADKVLAVGSPLLDLLLHVSDSFISSNVGEKGGTVQIPCSQIYQLIKEAQTDHSIVPGGAAGNTCRALALLGGNTAMLGMIGDDPNGHLYTAALKECGAGQEAIYTHPALTTGVCASFITPDGERTMRSDLGASIAIKEEDFQELDFKMYSWVYLEGYMLLAPELTPALLSRAQSSQCKIALDLSSFELVRKFREKMIKILSSHVNLVFANREEAQALLGLLSDVELAQKLSSMCSIAVLKMGKDGAIIASDGKLLHVPAICEINAIDTTGAGDAFAAGFLWGITQDVPLEECGKRGNAVAAEVIQIQGASLHANSVQKLKEQFN